MARRCTGNRGRLGTLQSDFMGEVCTNVGGRGNQRVSSLTADEFGSYGQVSSSEIG
jgi:hypothetical protein